uniref:RING-type domain-containing protein n=1 Tax=Athene cunicularia TaxID=194338 RepID=A0A663N4V7_ATHCN
MPFPRHGPQPCPSTPQGESRALGTIPQGCFPQLTEVLIPVDICSLPPECVLCQERNPSPSKQLQDKSLAPSSSTEAPAQEPRAPGGSVGCGPAAATSCALPGGVGLAGEALRLPLTGLLCSFQKCFVCGESGAAITCGQEGCDHSFHLPCAMEGECITQYFFPYRSFCREHRPEQEVEAALEEDTECLICLEPVEDRKSFHTLVCPACKHAWFHRGCIQYTAVTSFSCPHCRNRNGFVNDMLTMGIRVPTRLVSCWLTAQEAASPVPCPGLPCSPAPALSHLPGLQLHGGAVNRAGGRSRAALHRPHARSYDTSLFLLSFL